MSDHDIEQEIQAKGLNAPRVRPADIEANIASEHYFTAAEGAKVGGTETHPLDLLTFCVLTLRNGFTVTGESACASPENFDAEIGRRIARENAVAKVWPLMGYELKQRLAELGAVAVVDDGLVAASMQAGHVARQMVASVLAVGSNSAAIPCDHDGQPYVVTVTPSKS